MAYTTVKALFTAISDAVRAKLGTTGTIARQDLPAKIASITTGGGTTYEITGNIKKSGTSATGYAVTADIPSGVTSLGSSCFEECGGLTSITIPSSVTSLGDSCFYKCRNLTSITIPDGITSLENYCLGMCSELKSITIPSNAISLGDYCFYNDSNLTSAIFKGTPTTISTKMFNGCSRLTSIKVPWAEGAVSGAPWGATNATITYNYTGA